MSAVPATLVQGALIAASADVEHAEVAMLQFPQIDCPVIHRFSPGIYVREVHVPAGTLAIGHRQKTEHLNIFLRGRLSIVNENGSVSELAAPMIFIGKPGRKVGWTHEDIVWLNVYSTDETNVERLEEMLIDKSIGWEEHAQIALQSKMLQHEDDRADYFAVLEEFGTSHELARAQSEDKADQIDIPAGGYKCKVGTSAIDGLGLIATAEIAMGELIMPVRLVGKRTPAGRYTNHAKNPNAIMIARFNGDIDLVAVRDIRGCSGGADGEEITINYRHALGLQMTRAA
jgi:hypothetical protein